MTGLTNQQEIVIPHQFECREYQIPAWEALLEGKKRVVCCWHRGAGKDLFALNWVISRMIEEPCVYLHCFPQYAQADKAIWSSRHETDFGESMSYLDHFPACLIKSKNSQKMRIELINGAIYQALGIDGKNAQLARGMNPKHVIISEYAYMDPESWYTIEPRVIQNKGTVLFLSTPNGKNHFYNLYNYAAAGTDSDFFASRVTNDDTHLISDKELESMRAQGRPEDFIQQEIFCDFNRGAQGSYYGSQIQKARDDGRITNINPILDLPVHSAWDIGIGDANSIWVFQVLKSGNINLIHYYENSGVGLPHYINYLNNWKDKHSITFGTHFVPHDMHNKEYTSGVDRLAAARELGFNMTVVPKKGLDEGIEATRNILNRCSFDTKGCKRGIDCLDFYRKKWNESLKVYYDEPLHDQYSHGADAFRYLAIGINAIGIGSGKLTKESINEMRFKNLGY